jgi:hypothetical protein
VIKITQKQKNLNYKIIHPPKVPEFKTVVSKFDDLPPKFFELLVSLSTLFSHTILRWLLQFNSDEKDKKLSI